MTEEDVVRKLEVPKLNVHTRRKLIRELLVDAY
jgi:hypothetical protein